MADVSLNGLKVKTDSLPNDWYVSLINPKSDEPAEIMTVAKFMELFTNKQPEATDDSQGLISGNVFKNMMKIKNDVADANEALNTGYYGVGPNFESLPTNAYKYGLLIVFKADGVTQIYIPSSTISSGGVIYFRQKWTQPSMADVPWLMIQPATLSSYSNALTEAISASPVLESRQVGSTCLQNHLYQILLPSCLGRMDRMVQHQLIQNRRNSMSGQLTRSEKLSWNYRKKTRDLNKSSISLTIARYNKCNLPRAGPPRLIN